MVQKIYTKKDQWCYTATETEARNKIKMARSKARRNAEKEYIADIVRGNMSYEEILDGEMEMDMI